MTTTFELASNVELTGRELDALICERVFGLVRCQGAQHDADYPNTYCYALPESPAEGAESRCYSTSINDAWEIVEKLQPQFTITVRGYPDGSWECEFKEPHPRSSKRYRHYYVATTSAPLAICRAALKAVAP